MNIELDEIWEGIHSLCDLMGYKVESPTREEIRDRLHDGHDWPQWVLKDRHPTTHPVGYYATSADLLAALVKQKGYYESKQQRS